MYPIMRITDEVADGVSILHLCLALWVMLILLNLFIFYLPRLLELDWLGLLLLRPYGDDQGPRRLPPGWRLAPPEADIGDRRRPTPRPNRRHTTSPTLLRRRSSITKTE